MPRSLSFAAALACATMLASCGTTGPPATGIGREVAMLRALDADAAAGAIRNEAPRTAPLAEAVAEYVAALDGLDFEGCPEDFALAFRAHRDAWELMGEYLEPFGDLRGELHDAFDRIDVEENPTAAEFRRLLDDVWSTWGAVEASLARHGVDPPG